MPSVAHDFSRFLTISHGFFFGGMEASLPPEIAISNFEILQEHLKAQRVYTQKLQQIAGLIQPNTKSGLPNTSSRLTF